jgi:2'-5' RNA ligase
MKNWYKIAKKVSHSYSWVYIDLPKDVQKCMLDFGQEIDTKDLFEGEGDGGIENEPHITVKYGLLGNEIKDIKDCLNGLKGGKVHMGSSSIFEAPKYDVIKITVESDRLLEIHNKLNALPHEDKHLEYNAHATIAYVKSGLGKKYVGKFKLDKDFKFDEVYFDNKKKDYTIRLAAINKLITP